jgi:hypothetical protein
MSSSALLTQQATNTTEQLLSDEQLAMLLMIQQSKEKRGIEQSPANLAIAAKAGRMLPCPWIQPLLLL